MTKQRPSAIVLLPKPIKNRHFGAIQAGGSDFYHIKGQDNDGDHKYNQRFSTKLVLRFTIGLTVFIDTITVEDAHALFATFRRALLIEEKYIQSRFDKKLEP